MRDVLGGKGANLAEMTNLGVPVPPGFTIACHACIDYPARRHRSTRSCAREVEANLRRLEEATGKRLGDPTNATARLGAQRCAGVDARNDGDDPQSRAQRSNRRRPRAGRAAMRASPTIPIVASSRCTATSCSACRAMRFEHLLSAKRLMTGVRRRRGARRRRAAQSRRGVQGARAHRRPARRSRWIPSCSCGAPSKRSGDRGRSRRRVDYRQRARHPGDTRHRRQRRGDGLRQSRRRFGDGRRVHADPSHGRATILRRVPRQRAGRGRRRGHPHAARHRRDGRATARRLRASCSTTQEHARAALSATCRTSSSRSSAGSCICCRRGRASARRRPPCASPRDMVDEGLITASEAVLRVPPDQLDQLLHPVIDPGVRATAARHRPSRQSRSSQWPSRCSTPDEAERRAASGEAVILVREETTPEDFHGIVAARAVLTARGGMTSHAAVVARGMGKCAIVGCTRCASTSSDAQFTRERHRRRRGRLDHARWRDGPRLQRRPADDARARSCRSRAARSRRARRRCISRSPSCSAGPTTRAGCEVRANADTPQRRSLARAFGAEGIGLCRTEHMFFEGDRITAMREMIVARDEGGRRRALAKLLPMQRADFEGIFEAMDGLSGHDPAARSAAARVPAPWRRGVASCSRARSASAERSSRASSRACARRIRCSGTAAAASGSRIPRSPRCRGARSSRPRCGRSDAASTSSRRSWSRSSSTLQRVRAPARDPRGASLRQVLGGMGEQVDVQHRHDDRAAARRADGGRDRERRRVLLVRHERPDADHVRPEPRRRRPLPADLRRAAASFPTTRSRCSTRAAWASSSDSPSAKADACARSSRSASAASTAASRGA